jgi:hypothetical protein
MKKNEEGEKRRREEKERRWGVVYPQSRRVGTW